MNRRTFTRTLGLGALAAAGSLASSARAQDQSANKKLVVVGDGGVGKSALTIAFVTGNFVEEYDPTIADDYRKQIKVDDRTVLLNIWDTVGQAEHDKARRESYPGTHLFLVCFDVANRDSFANARTKWQPELAQYAPGVPFVVVGCKLDLRDEGRAAVGTHEAVALAEKLGAASYHECSAKTQTGVKLVFDNAIRITLI